MKSSIIAASAALPLLGVAPAARADSLHIHDMPLAGDYGGRYGHTIVIDGKICRLRNSAGFSAPQGCNYELRVDADRTLHAGTANERCSVDCEPSAAANRDGALSPQGARRSDMAPDGDRATGR